MVENYKHLYIYVIAGDLYVCMYVCVWGICRFVGMCTYCMRFFGILAAATAACCSYRSTFLLPTHIHVNIYTYIATYLRTYIRVHENHARYCYYYWMLAL